MAPKRTFIRWYQKSISLLRLAARSLLSRTLHFEFPTNVADLPIVFINLDKRVDRAIAARHNFQAVGITHARRFSAIARERGSLGCALSHLQALSEYQASNQPLMVCEDDLLFNCSASHLDALIEEFMLDSRLDVLCLANNVMNSCAFRIGDESNFLITTNSQTTACYVLKPHMFQPMIEIFKKSVELLKSGEVDKKGAIDVQWKSVQRKHIFVVPKERVATQAPGYSDILGRYVSYDR